MTVETPALSDPRLHFSSLSKMAELLEAFASHLLEVHSQTKVLVRITYMPQVSMRPAIDDASDFETAFPAAQKVMEESYSLLPRFGGEVIEGSSKIVETQKNKTAPNSEAPEDLFICLVLLFGEYAKRAPKEINPEQAAVLVARAATCLLVAQPLRDAVFSSDRLKLKWSSLQRKENLISVKKIIEPFSRYVIRSCITLKNQRKAKSTVGVIGRSMSMRLRTKSLKVRRRWQGRVVKRDGSADAQTDGTRAGRLAKATKDVPARRYAQLARKTG